MRIVLSLVLLTGLGLVGQATPQKSQPDKAAVPVLKADAVDSSAIKQVTTASPKLGHEIPTRVASLEKGLMHVQKISNEPILAMAQSSGWFFYATSVAWDSKTGEPAFMISGYAIKRDGQRVIGWSVW